MTEREYWGYTDEVIKYLKKKYTRAFRRIQGMTRLDEVNLLKGVEAVYEEVDTLTREYLLKIAKRYGQDDDWLDYWLATADPVTKYIYDEEVPRKAARCFESLLSSKNWRPEIKTALKYWTLQGVQYCETITREARTAELNTFKVRWVTAKDDKVCEECAPLDGKVFDIDKVPSAPHYHCRCMVVKA